ncbi:hypothetical protein [Sporosarcina limicola]|uniref:Uncharacterized protein n=1 Tax=Sporosarcina limicola TaxID=34101 RepID=A0A927R3F7_9BACL|nr:hypothetical protein [Sporosarcina limicola]MBE1553713.1 hypothetical protein [Sporosarcina limicola]
MKKLFSMSSSIMIEDYSSIQLNGPYELLKLGPNSVVIKSGEYIIEAAGEDLIVNTLSDEVAVFTFTSITSLNMKLREQDGAFHDR